MRSQNMHPNPLTSENPHELDPSPSVSELAIAMDRRTVVGNLWRTEGDHVRCLACGHRCRLGEGRRGICKVRFNRGGELRVPFGYVAGGWACDPVEKKPFFHLLPGSGALTFGMPGCNFHCAFCQNWFTSQALREPESSAQIVPATPEQIAGAAVRSGARLVVSSYNEPLITAEWAAAVFQEAVQRGLKCACVSNGYATAEALDLLLPWLASFKIDLKGFDDRRYRALGGTLTGVLDGIRLVRERGLWLEVVTLVVPGFNDSDGELRDIAQFIASISRDIPWHVTAFHPDFRMTGPAPTSGRQLLRAAEIGVEAGLHFVYAGNLPGGVGEWETTFCPGCRTKLVERRGFRVSANRITPDGCCPKCRVSIPGIWSAKAAVS